MKVAIYTRVSTSHQTTDNQTLELKRIAQRMGYDVVKVYEDCGISGAKSDRPAFNDLRMAVTRREIDMVMAWSIDRLGRSLQSLISFMEDMHGHGVDVYLAQQGINTAASPSSKLLFNLVSVFAEFERGMIVERVKAGLERAKDEGKTLGRPQTTDWKKNRVMKQLRLGKSVKQVADLAGVSPSTVSRIKRTMKQMVPLNH